MKDHERAFIFLFIIIKPNMFMKQSATLIPWVMQRLIPRCKSTVRNFLTMLFLLSGMIFATQKSDAQCNSFNIDFKQGANRDNFGSYTTGEIHWINSILQNSNSRYIEGMSTLQRLVFNNLASCNGNHVLRVKLETRKGDQHAYDFITSWDNALKASAAIAPGFGLMPANRADPKLHECGPAIDACSEIACNLVTGGGDGVGTGDDFRDLPIIFSDYANPTGPGEKNLLIEGPPADENTTRQAIQTYECRYGDNITVAAGPNAGTYDRSVRVYVDGGFTAGTSNGDANNAVYFVGYGNANPNDGGDTYIYYDIKWTSTSPSVVLEFAAHIAVGVDGLAAINPGGCNVTNLGVGYLLNRGASSISGGPYHVIVEDFQDAPGNTPKCEGNLGNLDNQLQGSEILLIPSCDLGGPSAVCANATATYTATVTNPDNATYLWEIINSSQSPPAATINGTASGNVSPPIFPATTTPLSITVSTGGIGTYTVKLTIKNGGQTTNNTDDDITSTCTFTTTVSGGPSITCPSSTTTGACQTQAQVDAAYLAWLATVSGSGTISHNGGSTGPNRCGGAKTVTFTATNTCGTSTCSATFTVTAPASVTLHCPTSTTLAACLTQAQVTAAYNAWLGTASGSGGCNGQLSNNSDGAPSNCGGAKTVTFTYTNSCSATQTCAATFTVTAPASVSLNCPTSTTVPACQTQAAVTAAYNAWLQTASGSGGCGGTLSNNSTGAPSNCGGAKTVTFTYTNSCSATQTCAATFTVTAPTSVTLNCATNTTFPAGLTQQQVDNAFAAWLATANASGGCAPGLSNNNTGAPPACGGAKTVTFTVTSSCEAAKTCSATFTVTAAATTSLTCPTSTSTGACQTQAAVNAAYVAWLATVQATGGTPTHNGGTVGPDRCGASKTVTFTLTAICQDPKTCSATFTVTAPASVSLSCPTSTTVAACQTQAQVTAAYNAWLATASASGGCDGTLSNNSSGAPSNCGGAKTVTFTYTNSCSATQTCAATFTVTAPASVSLSCPVSTTVAACQTQAQVTAAYNAWLATASGSGGCGGQLSNNSDGAPSNCGGAKTVTFTYTNSCSATQTCAATFTVTAPASVTLNCPVSTTVAACQTQAQVTAAYNAWLATASANGGCAGGLSNNSTGAPSNCGGAKTVTFTYTSSCTATQTCAATFTVTAPASVTLHCPTSTTVASCQTQAQVTAAYNAWLATGSGSGGCGGQLSNNSTGAPDKCGGAKTVTFTYTNSCSATQTCAATFTVTADNTPPTLTCAADKNTACDGVVTFDPPSASDNCGTPTVVIIADNQVNGNVHTTVWQATDACGNTATCSQNITVIECGKGCTLGFWKTHTEAYWPDGWHKLDNFWTAIGLDPTVDHCGLSKDLTIQGALETNGGACKAVVRQGAAALLNYATFGAAYPFGDPTTALHDALSTCDCPQSLIDDLNAANNNEFDADGNNICSALGRIVVRASRTAPVSGPDLSVSGLTVNAYPNPFKDHVRFVISSRISGQGSLEIYNMLGQRIQTVYNGNIVADRSQVVEYKVSQAIHGGLIYIFKQGGKQVTGKLLNIE
jgi:hypothetical protein